MKILQIHNQYQNKGGEDAVVETEKALLEDNGHFVIQYLRYNDEIKRYSAVEKGGLFLNTIWAKKSHKQVKDILEKEQPDLAHFHNTLPLISPAAYYACQNANVPVVQTLHNFRLMCPSALLFRDGRICERCLNHSLACSVFHSCYRDSRLQTATVALMLFAHKRMGTWTQQVDAYISLTAFMRNKFITLGLPEEKIFIKPNIPKNPMDPSTGKDGYALFFGRLSREKGLMTLLKAWENIPQIKLKIAGQGPLKKSLEQYIRRKNINRIELVGHRTGTSLLNLIQKARFVIHSSECYEGFPVSLAEVFSAGKPVIASRLGAMAEIIDDGKTGLLYTPGDAEDLAAKINQAMSHQMKMVAMGLAARRVYENKYTVTTNYRKLMSIYQRVAGKR